MRIKIIAKGRLKRAVGEDIINAGELELNSPAAVSNVVASLKLPEDEAFAVILNNRMIPSSRLGDEAVVDGDVISLIVPIRGG